MPKSFPPSVSSAARVSGTLNVPVWPGLSVTEPVRQWFTPSAPGLSTRQWTVTGAAPAFLTSSATWPNGERSQCPPGAGRAMPGQGCRWPVATRRAGSAPSSAGATVASVAVTFAGSKLMAKSPAAMPPAEAVAAMARQGR